MLTRSVCMHAGGYTPFGIEGWRVVFLTVGVVSFALGILNYFFAHDPRYAQDNKSLLKEHQHTISFWGAIAEMKRIVVIPSFAIIILQVSRDRLISQMRHALYFNQLFTAEALHLLHQQNCFVLGLCAHAGPATQHMSSFCIQESFFVPCWSLLPNTPVSAEQPTKIVCIQVPSFIPHQSLLPTICSDLGAKYDILILICRVLRGLFLSRHSSSSHCTSSCWAFPTLQPVPSCQASSLPLPLVACLAAGLETSKLLARLLACMHGTAACNPYKMLFRSYQHYLHHSVNPVCHSKAVCCKSSCSCRFPPLCA